MAITDNIKAALPIRVKNLFWPVIPNAPIKDQMAHKKGALDLSEYVAPIQFTRTVVDVAMWREAIDEMERQILPYRVKVQRIYADTYLNGQTYAAITKRKNLTLLKEFGLFNGETKNEEATKLLDTKWFASLMSYALDAQFFGYTLIGLGDFENNNFPNLKLIRRENVSPDRLSLSPIVYSPNSMVYFMDKDCKDDSGRAYYDWSIYVETPSETGQSRCGYGLLYKVALYEIYLRHNLSDNATFNEIFGQPHRVIKTDKTEKTDIDFLEKQAQNMGANAYSIIGHNDEIDFIDSGAGGNGYKSYESLEARLEKKISKIILGHADAIDSTPGKLGGQNNSEQSPVYQALQEVEALDNKFIEEVVNNQVLGKLRNIGLPIPQGLVFKFLNNSEIQEQLEKQSEVNAKIAVWLRDLKTAGIKVTDTKKLSEMLGIEVEISEEPVNEPVLPKNIKNQLDTLYDL